MEKSYQFPSGIALFSHGSHVDPRLWLVPSKALGKISASYSLRELIDKYSSDLSLLYLNILFLWSISLVGVVPTVPTENQVFNPSC